MSRLTEVREEAAEIEATRKTSGAVFFSAVHNVHIMRGW